MSGAASPLMLALLAFPAGVLAGWVHFTTLGRVAGLLAAGRFSAVALQVLRLALLGGFLWLCAWFGAAALLSGAAGIMAGRALVLRRAR